MKANSIRTNELQRFSDNSSRMLVEQDRFPEFLDSIGYEGFEKNGDGYRGPCPACLASRAYIGVNGKRHLIYWKCYNKTCDSNTGKSPLVRNLLGLVRGVSEDGGLGTAIETISTFLGYEGRSFDITNGKLGQVLKVSPEPAPRLTPIISESS